MKHRVTNLKRDSQPFGKNKTESGKFYFKWLMNVKNLRHVLGKALVERHLNGTKTR